MNRAPVEETAIDSGLEEYQQIQDNLETFAELIFEEHPGILDDAVAFINAIEAEERYEKTFPSVMMALDEEIDEDFDDIRRRGFDTIPDWEVNDQYYQYMSMLKDQMKGQLDDARQELPREIDDLALLMDKVVEEFIKSFEMLEKARADDEEDKMILAGNIYWVLLLRLLEGVEEESWDNLYREVVIASEQLREHGLENEVSQTVLSQAYHDELSISEIKDFLRIERAVIIHQHTDIGIKRAAEIADMPSRSFMEQAREYGLDLDME